MSLSSDIEDIGFAFEKMFFEDPYDDTWTLLKSSKNKDSILHRGFYYNHFRDNKKSTFFKCRRVIDKKECSGSFTLSNDGKCVCKEHQHEPMQPIECEIKIIMNEIDKTIEENPTVSIKNTYDQKEIELLKKYGPLKVAMYWPEFEKKDSHFFARKNKLIPKLPTSIHD